MNDQPSIALAEPQTPSAEPSAPSRQLPAELRSLGAAVLVFFFLSGCSGLIYEVVWTRLLRHVTGNTVYAMTTVLCAFMGGLALGSFVAGRIIDRRGNPVLVYAVMEGVIGLYCLSLPWIVDALLPLYQSIYRNFETGHWTFSLIRFVICGAILLPPATLMGATLPVLTRFFARSLDQVGWSIGRLYAVNTFGAVAGTFVTGFFLIRILGTLTSLYLGVALNFVICTAALLMLRHYATSAALDASDGDRPEEQRPPIEPQGVPAIGLDYGRAAGAVLLAGYGLSGMAALVYEVAWSRAISLLVGSSVYAFSLMLTAFIFGLAAGAAAFGRFVDRRRDPMRAMAIVEILIGATALLVVPIIGRLPFFLTMLIAKVSGSFWLIQLIGFGVMVMVMTVPALLMGAAFPLAIRIYTRSAAAVGRSVGTVYSVNTVGAILGAFAGGFLLLPAVGIQGAILGAVLLNVVVGCLFLAACPSLRPGPKVAAGVVVLGLTGAAVAVVPPWDPAKMAFGPFTQAIRMSKDDLQSVAALEAATIGKRIIFHREGVSTTATVAQFPSGQRTLFVNGKPDASSGGDMPTQVLSAHVPLLLHPDPKRVLVVGLASGVTCGSAALYPIERLECVEISPEVVEASHYFDHFNDHVQDDPRFKLILEDGRNHLALTDRKYDVIITEPSNPWMAGIGDLFTREFYEICRDRLNPDGVICGWLDSYSLGEDAFKSIVRTFHEVFPHTSLWNPIAGDFLLVGTRRQGAEFEALLRRFEDPRILGDLKRAGVRSMSDFFSCQLMTKGTIRDYGAGAEIHTDDNAYVEFSAPRTMFGRGGGGNIMQGIMAKRGARLEDLFSSGGKSILFDQLADSAATKRRARRHFDRAWHLATVWKEKAAAIEWFDRALKLEPDYLEAHFEKALVLGQLNDPKRAIWHLERAHRIDPSHVDTNRQLADIRFQQKRYREAVEHALAASESSPYSYEMKLILVRAYEAMGQASEAAEALRAARELGAPVEETAGLLESLRRLAAPAEGSNVDGAELRRELSNLRN